MAGDWIKMRIDLLSHPKIVRILSATKSDKFRVVGGLHAVWSIFDTHSEDGVLNGYSPYALDHVIGWDGFSAALLGVGWLQESDEGLVMPEFEEHNGKSGKRRAEDQKRKRESRKSPEDVRNLSAKKPDKMLTREEKRREEDKDQKLSAKKTKSAKSANSDFDLPDWIDPVAWSAFVEMRVKIKKPMSGNAMTLAVKALEKLKAQGHQADDVLNQSTFNSWQGLFAIKQDYSNGQANRSGSGAGRLSAVDQVRAENDAAEARRRAARPAAEVTGHLQESPPLDGDWERELASICDADGKIVGHDGGAVRTQVGLILRDE
jgi:hypothetical protein